MRRKPSAEARRVARWNLLHPAVGVFVSVRLDDGRTVNTRTRSAAALLGGHTGVIWLEPCEEYRFPSAYLLERVTAL